MNAPQAHPIRGILFDKDGTLIDFKSAWIPAGMQAAERLCAMAKAPHQLATLLRLAGYEQQGQRLEAGSLWACGTSRELLAEWIQKLDLQGGDVLLDEILGYMTDVARAHSEPVTDLVALFGDLRARDCKLGVATMDLQRAAAAILEGFGIRPLVDFVCGCDSGFGHKPNPGMVQAFCSRCDLNPEDILVVGDTPHDLLMGRAAGAGSVVAVMSGVASREMLEPHADHVLDSIEDLRELLQIQPVVREASPRVP